MDSRKETVKKAITFNDPAYVPILFFNRDKDQSDIIMIDVVRHFEGKGGLESEWGFVWERNDETMGQPKEPLLTVGQSADSLRIPDPKRSDRFEAVHPTMERYGRDRYYLASLVLSGFTVMSFLKGFSETLIDLYTDDPDIHTLADIVFGFESDVIRLLPGLGFDGVAFFDDWGTQTNLIISPELFRRFFKPRYKAQFDLVHSLGMDVYFHCCGYILDIIPDLIEVGVDVLNLSQPNIFDIEALGRNFAGKVCFVCPVSYQTTGISGSREEIFAEAARLAENLKTAHGGFIGYVEEYHSIGMSEENYRACIDAFRSIRYKQK